MAIVLLTLPFDQAPIFKSVLDSLNKQIADLDILSARKCMIEEKDFEIIEISYTHVESLFILGIRFNKAMTIAFPDSKPQLLITDPLYKTENS